MYFVYLLQCVDRSIYTGITPDVEKRFREHENGTGAKYTRSHKPVKILYIESFATRSEAASREYEIKSWPRKKKLRLIARKGV
jgi:putative endonuclease